MGLLSAAGDAPQARRRLWVDLALFVAICFGVSWGLLGFYIWNPALATRTLGEMKLGHPAFFAAVYAPSLAALALTALRYGRRGLADLFGAVVRVRARWVFIAVALLGYPLLWLATELARAAVAGRLGAFDFTPWTVALPAVVLGTQILRDPGAFGEELGWRGFALPRLLEFMDARAAALVLGLVWAVWHLPAFFLSSLSQSNVNFGLFVLHVLAFSAAMTWLFVNTRGSVFWAGIVPHFIFNATPRAGIAPTIWVAVLVGAAILVLGGKHLRGWGRPRAVLPQSTLLSAGGDAD